MLNSVKGVNKVNSKFASNVASIFIECNTIAEKLTEVLAEKFDEAFEITDICQNVIDVRQAIGAMH